MFKIKLMSFGFKYGLPRANNYIDVSFLKNPAREFGLDSEVDDRHIKFVKEQESYQQLIPIVLQLAEFIASQKDSPVLAFGCSSGKHRSVIVANDVAEILQHKGYEVTVIHMNQN